MVRQTRYLWSQQDLPIVGGKYVHEEGIICKRIVVHLYSANISKYLKHETSEHATQESPCSIFDSENNLCAEHYSEERKVEGIGSQRWDVL